MFNIDMLVLVRYKRKYLKWLINGCMNMFRFKILYIKEKNVLEWRKWFGDFCGVY